MAGISAGMKLIRKPKSAKYQYDEVEKEVRSDIEKFGKRVVAAFNKITENWKNQPRFKSIIGYGQKQITLTITLENPNEKVGENFNISGLWKVIDKKGRKPMVITPKKAKMLSFIWGGPGSYRSKTSANPARYGGPGDVVGGERVAFYSVNWPGFEPRRFSETLKKDPEIKEGFGKAIDAGLKRGFRKIP